MSLRPSNTIERRIIIPDQIQQNYHNYQSEQQNYHPYAYGQQKNRVQNNAYANRHIYQKQMQQQVRTPSWGNNNNNNYINNSNNIRVQQLQFHNSGFKAKNNSTVIRKTTKIQNISRLDQLLSKNQLIYQHMRNQLQQISRSNQNINNNINIIKPLSESQAQQIQREYQSSQKYRKLYENNQANSQFKQPFTFTSNSQAILTKEQQSSQNSIIKSHKKHNIYLNTKIVTAQSKIQNTNNSNQNAQQKYRIVVNDTTKQEKKFSISAQSPESTQNSYLLHPAKKQIYKVVKLHEKSSTYYEPDSSPVASQMLNSIQNNKINKNQQFHLSLHKMNDSSDVDINTTDKYQTFQQEDKVQLNSNKLNTNNNDRKSTSKQNTFHEKKFNITPKKLNMYQQKQGTSIKRQKPAKLLQEQQLKWIPQIYPISIAYVPFNKLYSSPILQLSNKNQLILARKSKTQLTTNTSTNRIVNGIKYKNVNLIHDQIKLYEVIVNHSRKIQQTIENNMKIMNNYVRNNENTENIENIKNSIDIGIVGGQNTLKKKLHFSLLAHVYAELIQFIERIVNNFILLQTQQQSNNEQEKPHKQFTPLVIGIEHQQQQSLGDPYMIKYQGQIGLSQIQNQIAFANIRAAIQQIYACMKMKLNNGNENQRNNEFINGNISNIIYSANKNNQNRNHRIRVTKLYLKHQPIFKQNAMSNTFQSQKINNKYVQDTLYNTKIISTNKVNKELIQSLQLDSVIWCVNPLFKYYQETKQCLDCYNQYKSNVKNKKELY